MLPTLSEETVYLAIRRGELEIDAQGRVWRILLRHGTRWGAGAQTLPCKRRRAENRTGRVYLQVRVMVDWKRTHCMAHRLVWRHLHGPIPPGLTINHKNGKKDDNRPENLELATYADQQRHALHVLKVGRTDQTGSRNAMAVLTEAKVREIRRRRATGERLRSIAADFHVTMQTVSRIARGDRWAASRG